jgi:hypothetical protein
LVSERKDSKPNREDAPNYAGGLANKNKIHGVRVSSPQKTWLFSFACNHSCKQRLKNPAYSHTPLWSRDLELEVFMLTYAIRALLVSSFATNIKLTTVLLCGTRYKSGVYQSNVVHHMVSKPALLNNVPDITAPFTLETRQIITAFSKPCEHITGNRNALHIANQKNPFVSKM